MAWFKDNYCNNKENGLKQLKHVFSGITQGMCWYNEIQVFTQPFKLQIKFGGKNSRYTWRFGVQWRLVVLECISWMYKNVFHMWITASGLTAMKRQLGIPLHSIVNWWNFSLAWFACTKLTRNTQNSWMAVFSTSRMFQHFMFFTLARLPFIFISVWF